MMGETSIQWTDATWNPVRGCSRVSPGCDNCYAMLQARRFDNPGGAYEGLTRIGKRGVDWSGVVRLVPEMLDVPLRWRRPRRIFVNSMSDLFHESLSNEQIAAVFGVMAACPQHTFQVLTKRAKRMREWFEWYEGTSGAGASPYAAVAQANHVIGADLRRWETRDTWPLLNVWLGVSAEGQQRADERIPHLLATPAAVRFVSAEPLLGQIDLLQVAAGALSPSNPTHRVDVLRGGTWNLGYGFTNHSDMPGTLDWIIVGGESGPGARPCHIDWIRSIVTQCRAAGVACFVKQLGSFPDASDEDGPGFIHLRDRKGGDPVEWPESFRVREFPARAMRDA